jgi:hypothetical protein
MNVLNPKKNQNPKSKEKPVDLKSLKNRNENQKSKEKP